MKKETSKEELIFCFEKQMENLKDMCRVGYNSGKVHKMKSLPRISVGIDYSVAGSEVLHPNFKINIVDASVSKPYFYINTELNRFELSTDEFNSLFEKYIPILDELKSKSV